MSKALLLLALPGTAVLVVAGLTAGPALADWDVGDPYKMHYPQLPDPTGWDVKASYSKVLADDWLCTQTGPVSDLHFWGSWEGDKFRDKGPPAPSFEWFTISIYADIPDPDGLGPEFSKPGDQLWTRIFDSADVAVRLWGTGNQGWYDPNTGWYDPGYDPDHPEDPPNHVMIFQYNIEDIANPFIQNEGTIYWLAISMQCNYGTWGWKTSLDHWNDDGVWRDEEPLQPTNWAELHDPLTGVSLDMAFVITPEPAAVVFLALGSLLLRRRMRC